MTSGGSCRLLSSSAAGAGGCGSPGWSAGGGGGGGGVPCSSPPAAAAMGTWRRLQHDPLLRAAGRAAGRCGRVRQGEAARCMAERWCRGDRGALIGGTERRAADGWGWSAPCRVALDLPCSPLPPSIRSPNHLVRAPPRKPAEAFHLLPGPAQQAPRLHAPRLHASAPQCWCRPARSGPRAHPSPPPPPAGQNRFRPSWMRACAGNAHSSTAAQCVTAWRPRMPGRPPSARRPRQRSARRGRRSARPAWRALPGGSRWVMACGGLR